MYGKFKFHFRQMTLRMSLVGERSTMPELFVADGEAELAEGRLSLEVESLSFSRFCAISFPWIVHFSIRVETIPQVWVGNCA